MKDPTTRQSSDRREAEAQETEAHEAKANEEFRRAIQLHTEGQLEAAIDAYRAILKRHPKVAGCWSNLGAALRTLGRKDEGLQVLLEGERRCPEMVDLSFNLGNALSDAGEHEEALKRYRTILPHDPRHLMAAVRAGSAPTGLERLSEAVDPYTGSYIHLRAHETKANHVGVLRLVLKNTY